MEERFARRCASKWKHWWYFFLFFFFLATRLDPPRRGGKKRKSAWRKHLFWDNESTRVNPFFYFLFPADSKWEELHPGGERPPALQEHSAVAYKDCLYIFGGELGFSAGTETPLWVYNVKVTYHRLGRIPTLFQTSLHVSYGSKRKPARCANNNALSQICLVNFV